MTEAAPKLWVTDDELIKASGVPAAKMKQALAALDRDGRSGFPKKDPLYDNRRYWPAVLEYWRVTHPVRQPRQSSPQDLSRAS